MVNGFRYYRALESVSIASAFNLAFNLVWPLCITEYYRAQHSHMGTTIKHPMPEGWASECPDVKNYKWRLNRSGAGYL